MISFVEVTLHFWVAWLLSSLVHELGHYCVAHFFGIQVTRVAIWGGSRFGFKIGQCHFSVGIAPFFSYCKIDELPLTPRELWSHCKSVMYLWVVAGGCLCQLLSFLLLYYCSVLSDMPRFVYMLGSLLGFSAVVNLLPFNHSDGSFLFYPLFGKRYYMTLTKQGGAVLSLYKKNGRWLTYHQVYDEQLYSLFQIQWYYFRFRLASKRRIAHTMTGYKHGLTGIIKINRLPW